MSSSTQPEGPWTKAAVLLAIFGAPPHDVIFIQRAGHLRKHAGQIGLPGGTEDPIDDGKPETTALRETYEELGVGAERVRVVGRLPEHRQMSNRFLVTPVVGVIESGTRLVIDEAEIVGFFTVPLESIVSGDALHEDVELSAARGTKMYALDFDGHHIWGLTGRILKTFSDAWNAPDSDLRRDVEAAFATS